MKIHEKIEHALSSGPTAEAFLALIVEEPLRRVHVELMLLIDSGKVERAPEIGPYTYRLVTPKGDS